MGKGRIIIIGIMLLVFLCGILVFCYPYIQGIIVDQRIIAEAHSFLERQETEPTQTLQGEVQPEETVPREYEELWNAMVSYNEQIWTEKQVGLCDPWSYEQPSFTLGEYGLEDEAFGVIRIPKLDLELPIYLGATAQHMNDGAAHLSQTSLPIGGINTNSTICGHRGWGGASYFRYITDLEPGDEVIITNLWETLAYEVVGTEIIQPNDVEKILVQEGKDMLTLLTCHPYASGGRQRYLVFCERATPPA